MKGLKMQDNHGFWNLMVACVMGALVSALRRRGISKVQMAIEVISGSAVAYYGSLFAVHQFNTAPETTGAVGFFIGLVGMELTGVLVDTVRDYGPTFVQKAIRKFLGVK